MASVKLHASLIPDLSDKVAVVVGGATGIGKSLVQLLCSKGAKVFVVDTKSKDIFSTDATYIHGDITSWPRLCEIFLSGQFFDRIDMCFANAGIGEDPTNSILNDANDPSTGELSEPNYALFDVNLRGTLNVVKLSLHLMKTQTSGGSIVITSSATAYAPEQTMPIYCASKAGLIALIRTLRSTLRTFNISINGVAPAATETPLLPPSYAGPMRAAGLPVSDPMHVALALAYSATALEQKKVELYGKEFGLNKSPHKETTTERWNGRVLLTLGDTANEVEEPLADLREQYLGEFVTRMTRTQQAVTDFRFPMDSTK